MLASKLFRERKAEERAVKGKEKYVTGIRQAVAARQLVLNAAKRATVAAR